MSFPFAAALLAGGTSRRMGEDKAFLEIDGLPLWERQLATLQELAPDHLIISANQSQDFSAAPATAEVLVDGQYDAGPLAALLGCLTSTGLPTLVLAVDMPAMTTTFLRDTILATSSTERGTVCNRQGRAEPLAALYPTTCIPHAEHELAHGVGALQPFVATCADDGLIDRIDLAPSETPLFHSLNHPTDLPPSD